MKKFEEPPETIDRVIYKVKSVMDIVFQENNKFQIGIGAGQRNIWFNKWKHFHLHWLWKFVFYNLKSIFSEKKHRESDTYYLHMTFVQLTVSEKNKTNK